MPFPEKVKMLCKTDKNTVIYYKRTVFTDKFNKVILNSCSNVHIVGLLKVGPPLVFNRENLKLKSNFLCSKNSL